jgi:hypothetical protein
VNARTRANVRALALAALLAASAVGHLAALQRAFGPVGTPRARLIHSLRLPLQVPLVAWAWKSRLTQ